MDKKTISKIKEISPNLTKEEKISEIKRIIEEKNEPELVIIKDIKEVLTKLADILGVVSNIENQDVKTYEEELQNLVESISELKETITDKDMVVNIPLDNLASSISRVETAVKSIKFPEIPETVVNEVSFKDDEIIDAIKKIPQFPIEDIKKMFVGITEMLSNTPEFNYERLEKKLDGVIRAIGKIDLSVYGGGGNSYVRNAKSEIVNPATSDNQTNGEQKTKIYASTSDTTVQIPRLDPTTHSLQSIDYAHKEIHTGSHYYICDFVNPIQTGVTLDFVVTTANTASWSHTVFWFASTLGASLEVFEGCSNVVGGTSVTAVNNNRNSTNTSGMTILKAPSSITTGTRISGYLAGANRVAGATSREAEVILKQNTTYLFRFTSLANSNAISFCAEWYEHISKLA